MKVYQGKGVSRGIAIGRICVFRGQERVVTRRKIEDAAEELARYEDARENAIRQLQALHEKAINAVGEEQAAIFNVHRMILEDKNFNAFIENLIRDEQVNAEYATVEAGAHFAQVFGSMEDAYIKERAVDIQDVSNRVVDILDGAEEVAGAGNVDGMRGEGLSFEEPVIIVAEDLTPSQTVQFDREKVLALVTAKGSATSHTAILAKTMGIPAIVGADLFADRTLEGFDGVCGAVDGTEGRFYVEPDEETLALMKEHRVAGWGERLASEEYRGLETVTSDGRRILLYANVGSLKDLEFAIENDAEGIGLFRSEFLYLERDSFPTEEEQFQIYKQAAEAMEGKSIVIRTLDIGADKQCDYMELPNEKNSTMGCRGIRVCLNRPEIFKTQLRALFRAALYGDLAIMYPMIASISEIRQVKKLVQEVAGELTAEQIAHKVPKQGIMIETPAAALISDILAKEVDFFSIGTNDLTQYTLAMDRENGALDRFFDAHHPAILRLIAMTVENAHKAGILVGICGELAADKTWTAEWVKLGVDELSVTSGSILSLRGQIRKISSQG